VVFRDVFYRPPCTAVSSVTCTAGMRGACSSTVAGVPSSGGKHANASVSSDIMVSHAPRMAILALRSSALPIVKWTSSING
jgi:hypothetical protein